MLKIMIIDKEKNTCVLDVDSYNLNDFFRLTNFSTKNAKKNKTRKKLDEEITFFLKGANENE